MENFYLIIVIVLFALAISDLIVGVSNDAVNFLNSAIGAKVANFKVIMIVAALGILLGATFSGGMMEVARKGIFHPEHFVFSEIIIIFLAVMITDVILLDLFNTFGLPTSTTVSIVFELLGSAVAVSTIKIANGSEILVDGVARLGTMGDYINSANALGIISGILLSVVVAFTVGAVIMWISRLIISFDFQRTMKYYSGIFSGIAVTAITYFILVKGIKGSFFADIKIFNNEITLYEYVKTHTALIIGSSFVFWTIIFQILYWLKLNILKVIVLIGTFALAMAFAGNDLVNFIGVPLAGFEAFQNYIATPGADPDLHTMAFLAEKIKTPPYFLVIAGLIMVVTLWYSRKARSVVKTSLDLSRQSEGEERFGSSVLSRSIVWGTRNISENLNKVVPKGIRKGIQKQFDTSKFKEYQKTFDGNPPEFDLVRASINLVVASILISFATSLKLPLSTTYVTFMVAMGTSLSDKAWGRESAVYRITGVLSVIGGWFLTAFAAFTLAFIMAHIINIGSIYAVTALILLAVFMVFRTHRLYSKKEKERIESLQADSDFVDNTVVIKCSEKIISNLEDVSKLYNDTIKGLNDEDRKKLRKLKLKNTELNKEAKYLKNAIPKTIKKLRDDNVDTGVFYVQVLDHLREIAHCMTFIIDPGFEHIDNSHKKLTNVQIEELSQLGKQLKTLIDKIVSIVRNGNYEQINEVIQLQQDILALESQVRKNQFKRIKNNEVGTKNSMLFIGILHETHSILLHLINLLKSQRDFVNFSNSEETK